MPTLCRRDTCESETHLDLATQYPRRRDPRETHLSPSLIARDPLAAAAHRQCHMQEELPKDSVSSTQACIERDISPNLEPRLQMPSQPAWRRQ
nr:hypothetical protein CFP56_41198 [Quercus suber]